MYEVSTTIYLNGANTIGVRQIQQTVALVYTAHITPHGGTSRATTVSPEVAKTVELGEAVVQHS